MPLKAFYIKPVVLSPPNKMEGWKRKHQHILNIVRALLFQSNTSKNFWSFAVNRAVYIMNRDTSRILNNKSPYHLLFNELSDLQALRIFGTLAYAPTIQSHRKNLNHRGRKCVFLGFRQGVKGAILLDMNNNEIFLSQNVVHHEYVFHYQPN